MIWVGNNEGKVVISNYNLLKPPKMGELKIGGQEGF